MSVELVTGYSSGAHVSSSEDGARQAGTIGTGMYALRTVDDPLAATLENANTVSVGPGDVLINGRHVQLSGSTAFAIPVGTQGQQTSNLLVLRYDVAEGGTESVTPQTITGQPAASNPQDPALATGSILDGDAPVDMPLYRVVTTGIETAQPVKLFTSVPCVHDVVDPVASETDAADSTRFLVSPSSGEAPKYKTGTRVWNWVAAKIRSVFGFSSSNVLTASHGGTGQVSLQASRNAMGLGNTLNALPVANGGTGATAAAQARTNLGCPPTNHSSTGTGYGPATSANYGHVKLSDSTTSSSGASAGVAATPAAVKAVRDSVGQLLKKVSASASASGSSGTVRLNFGAIPSGYDILGIVNLRSEGFVAPAYCSGYATSSGSALADIRWTPVSGSGTIRADLLYIRK